MESSNLIKQGAEARLYICEFLKKKCIAKKRFVKSYRHPDLDKSLTLQRLKNEVRTMVRCRQYGICTPALYSVDIADSCIYMEYLEHSITLKDHVDALLATNDSDHLDQVAILIGQTVANLHKINIIHGDLTTSNFLVNKTNINGKEEIKLVLIDFGLSTIESAHNPEDKGVDLYVLERAFLSSHPNTEKLFDTILCSYQHHYDCKDVLAKLDEIRLRGRKRTMVG